MFWARSITSTEFSFIRPSSVTNDLNDDLSVPVITKNRATKARKVPRIAASKYFKKLFMDGLVEVPNVGTTKLVEHFDKCPALRYLRSGKISIHVSGRMQASMVGMRHDSALP